MCHYDMSQSDSNAVLTWGNSSLSAPVTNAPTKFVCMVRDLVYTQGCEKLTLSGLWELPSSLGGRSNFRFVLPKICLPFRCAIQVEATSTPRSWLSVLAIFFGSLLRLAALSFRTCLDRLVPDEFPWSKPYSWSFAWPLVSCRCKWQQIGRCHSYQIAAATCCGQFPASNKTSCLPFLPNLVPEWRGKKKKVYYLDMQLYMILYDIMGKRWWTYHLHEAIPWQHQKCQKANQEFRSQTASLEADPNDNHQAWLLRYLDSASSIVFESSYCLQRQLYWSCMSGLIYFCVCHFNNVVWWERHVHFWFSMETFGSPLP